MVEVETRYARASDGAYIAYQMSGAGPDVVWQPDWPGNIDMEWEFPVLRTLHTALSGFARLIRHDHRGVGLSSRNVPIPTLETRVSDLLAVLDDVPTDHPVLVGAGSSGAVNALLAATRPDRASALIWLSGDARYTRAEDYPWGRTPEELVDELADLERWGTEAYGHAFAEREASLGNPIPEDDIAAFSKASRNACTPDVAIELARMWAETDVREILSTIQVPTLVVAVPEIGEVDRSRDLASRIPGSRFATFEGGFSRPGMIAFADLVRGFVGAAGPPLDLDTVLATVLFTDIVGSTERQATIGDRAWQDLIERHHAIVREALGRWRGTEHDTAGDGFFATFDGPARAIRCADEIVGYVRDLGIEIRAGIHVGECRTVDGKVGGLAVSIGARVATSAGPSEIRVTGTVKDLVAGSGLTFVDLGEHELKGVPGRWPLFAASAPSVGSAAIRPGLGA
jgi:class 3 adenylate cyclase/pimeloyl-ACP methyl ester carboxylesterase